ncbi:MAG TPA: protoporphyrinogen oxidase [Candidatus Cryosericum sp.]|nr:protoporphyrinogen oxidase [Candidatus Cryosericum sp.]
MEPAPLRVAVVGCGIAGLSCGFTLIERGRERRLPVDVTLFEAERRAGGVIRTERRDGFVIEGGPDCFITDKPWALDLCRRLGLAEELASTNPDCRRSYVLRGRRLLPIPEGFYLMAPARLLPFAASSVLSPAGRLRAGLDLFLPRGPEVPDESLASFVSRRFGTEVLERLAQPLLAGIYNAEPERLSLRATMPRFLELERQHRSVIVGLLRGRRRPGGGTAGVSGARYSLFVTPRRGMESIVDRLLQEIPGPSLRLQTRVTALPAGPFGGDDGGGSSAASGGRWRVRTSRGETLPFHAVVLALRAPETAPLVRPFDPGLADLLAGIAYGGSTTVSLAWRTSDVPRPLAGFGFVVPRAEKRKLIACSFSSVKFPGRAPEGSVLLRAFTSDALIPGDDTDQAIACVREELREILGIEAEPQIARAYFHPGAMARYDVGHLDRVADIESHLERHAGLALAGNGLRGVGVPDCVRSGAIAAERILSQAARLVS